MLTHPDNFGDPEFLGGAQLPVARRLFLTG
jgi:hypothetical protein